MLLPLPTTIRNPPQLQRSKKTKKKKKKKGMAKRIRSQPRIPSQNHDLCDRFYSFNYLEVLTSKAKRDNVHSSTHTYSFSKSLHPTTLSKTSQPELADTPTTLPTKHDFFLIRCAEVKYHQSIQVSQHQHQHLHFHAYLNFTCHTHVHEYVKQVYVPKCIDETISSDHYHTEQDCPVSSSPCICGTSTPHSPP